MKDETNLAVYLAVNATTTHEAYAQYQSLYDSGAYVAGQIVVKVVQNLDWKHANPTSNSTIP